MLIFLKTGTISVVEPNEYPIKLYFSEERSRQLWVLDYKGDNDLQGTWKSNDGNPKSDWYGCFLKFFGQSARLRFTIKFVSTSWSQWF